jgi:outer membrane receptor for ferrienterochelin and colicins
LLLAVTLGQTPKNDPPIDAPKIQTVVTGSRTERRIEDAVTPTEVITRAQIDATGARDLGSLLQQHQGVELVYSFRGVGIRLQGLDPEYVLILIDGERVSGRIGNTIDLSRYSLRDVERIEIVKGPAAALYGSDAIGGVINLLTRRVQNPWEASLRGSVGTREDYDVRAHAGMKRGPFELRLGGGYRQALSYDLDPRDAATSGPGFRRFDGDAALIVTPKDGIAITGKLGYLRRDENAVDISPTGATFDRRGRQEQFDTSLKVALAPRDGTAITIRGRQSLFRDQLLQDQRGARDYDQYTQNVNRLWEASVQADQKLGNHTLTGGLELLSELLSSPRLSTGNAQHQRYAALIQDEWDFSTEGPKLKIAPGIRIDADTQFGVAPSPRLAIKVDPSAAWTLRASWGLGFRAPSFSELYLLFDNASVGYVVEGNPLLRPETSASLNLAVDWRPPLQGWLVSASVFHTDIANLITINTNDAPNPDNPTRFRYGNVASAYTQGLELSARARLSRGTYLDVGYTYLDARDNVKQRPLEGRAAHKANAALSARYPSIGLELLVRSTYNGPRPFYLDDNSDGVEETKWVKGYVDLEATISWTFRDWLRLYVNGFNLTNAGDAVYLPRPPRGVLGGVEVRY